ncbi:multi-sensor signal transduction histidine kinase [Nostoc linckia NIES-25]|nr:multi-sensor signal transduction histidine kinase [Nostoc linckia NIES-25]
MSVKVVETVKIASYEIVEQLYSGSRTQVYRAVRQCDRQPVVIKLLKREYPTLGELVQFRNQYAIAKNLDIPGIIKPYSLEPYHNGYALVMEDFGGISLRQFTCAKPLTLQEFLPIALQLLDTLHQLHQQRVIHKDIKPANILIHPDTKQVKLIDFSIASLLPRETQEIQSINGLEGTLAYLSPEQTGRMNRGIDYRSDFYSLGVTFFELLSGQLPFTSDEPMELVHSHIAKQPNSICDLNPEMPLMLGEIICKLMAKNAENRYQSALGLKYDLEKCYQEWQATGKHTWFDLAQHDISDRFLIREKLYGREQEVKTLLEAFGRVANGAAELMLVAGFSGIGKTAVVNEVHKPIVRWSGYFIKGKYDQFDRNIPLSAFVRAFCDLMTQLLAETDSQLQQWRNKILSALGESGQVIIDVIPQLEQIIGKQPPAPELSGAAAQNRFNSHLSFADELQQITNDQGQITNDQGQITNDQRQITNDQGQITNDQGQKTVYKFLHDRVQQAAYSLIPEEQKQATHLRIGQLLLNNTPVTKLDENLFEIVNQLNIGKSLIIERSPQIKIAELNLQAGHKAKAATAYAAAYQYSTTGIALLNFSQSQDEYCWQTHYNLTLELHELAAETAYLSGDFGQMEQWIDIVMQEAKTSVDKMKVYAVKIQASMAQVKKLEAVKIGLEALQLLGVTIPQAPEASDIQQAIAQVASNLEAKNIEELINLPLMTDIEHLCAARILATIGPATYQAAPILFPLVISELVNLSINYGNSPFSSYGYACYGILLNAVFHNIESAYQVGKLALTLAEKFNFPDIKGSTFFVVGVCINHGKVHVRETLPILLDAYQSGLEGGNFVFATHAVIHKSQHAYLMGQELTIVAQEMATISDVLARLKQENALSFHQIFQQSAINLLNYSENPCILQGEVYNEKIALPKLLDAHDRTGLHHFYFNKLILCYFFGDYLQAHKNALQAEQYLDGVPGLLVVPVSYFYDSLTHLAIYPSVADLQRENLLNRVTNNQEKMKQWATDAPMNFQHKFDLVAAEQHRILGNKAEAMDYYDRAITLAKEHGYVQEEALANELAAKFYLDWGKQRIAQEYMTEAYYGYARWGAKAKVADLEKRYPQLLAPILQQTRSPLSTSETIFNLGTITSTSSASSSSSSVSVALDLAAILKAFQILSGEIELEKLLSTLLNILIENSGAEKCVLLLSHGEQLMVQSVTCTDFSPVLLKPQFLEDSQDVPISLINTVKRSLQPTVIIDARVHGQLTNDPYIQRQQPKSILCSPILHQGKLLGVLYLENNLVTGAFTSDRVELLNLLCAQAAISLENAQLYGNSQTYAQELAQSLAKLQASEIRFQNLANNIPGMVYQFRLGADGSTSTPYVSSGCLELYGLEPELVMAGTHSLYAMNHPDDNPAITQAMIYSAQTLTPFEKEWRIILPSGTVKWIQSAARPERQADGAILWDGVVIDISDRKQSEVALQQKSHDLEQALTNLQNAQLQIIQSEKMSALGNLVAGVAHEMNNPLGFISASLKQTKPTIADLVEHLKLYQESLPNKSEEILEHAQEIDLDYTLEDLPKVIDSMTLACERLKNISTSLRTFSRADRDYKVAFNIHQGIDSTILILKHRLKANEQRPAIEVLTEYSNLPQIECFPGQLNQVFMNLLANAIDALEDANNGLTFEQIQLNPNLIKIQTFLENHSVKVIIADNGKGMSEEVKQNIFDHLFTTKGVGKGTGLGLAIARQIIEEAHNGNLNCNSVLGQGTEFVITLPIKTMG